MSDTYHRPDQKRLQTLRDIANKLRVHSIEATSAANSGHPTSCCSAAEIMAVLFFHEMRYKGILELYGVVLSLVRPGNSHPVTGNFTICTKISTTLYVLCI
jgi:hypothetical protein